MTAIRWDGPLYPSGGISVDAEAASGTGAANDATISRAVRGEAGAASGTGTAHDASVKITVNAGLASGTGSALQPTKIITGRVVFPDAAVGTGTAYAPTTNRLDHLDGYHGTLTEDVGQTLNLLPVAAAVATSGAGPNIRVHHRSPWRCHVRSCGGVS